MKVTIYSIFCFLSLLLLTSNFYGATVILYNQDFENPVGFQNDGGDVNIVRPVNSLYGGQPAGFQFTQQFTVETLLVTGTQAWGTGYTDASGIGGNYCLGMLSNRQNDLVGLSFNVTDNDFLNIRMDISSIDLSVFGGPFVSNGAIPIFKYTLFDNPTGTNGLNGNGTILDSFTFNGTASPQSVFDWTEALIPLSTDGNINGNVTLQIDLLQGGYAAMDNFQIAASNTSGDVGDVPEPTTMLLLGLGLFGFIGSKFKRK